ncbi:MAG: chromosomal replication initiator protein DnaA [Firmicutes bacterium]|jgi:chromosomal replication initiator protein|nr:chromosomal replication initiator protein DnaA [Bacillota bacterium]
MIDHDAIWTEVLDIMASELSGSSLTGFQTWLKQAKSQKIEGNVLYIEVPNEVTKDWVEARYSVSLQRTLRRVVNQNLELRFVVVNKPVSSEVEPEKDQKASLTRPQKEKPSNSSNDDSMSSLLNPKYTFETFVVGAGNRFAHAASLAVAESPSRAYNPLFIYGGVGLGKTHLMHAIGHYALEQNPNIKIMYVSSETFTNDLINAIGQKSMVEFRNKYRSVDILLIDDIQFVAGKESTQIEFFHTFNSLYEANKQLIISSDRPPKEIPALEERLRSRFEWGLITDIQPPDLETRVAILKKKADLENIVTDPEVLTFIAKQVQSNIRELEGAFTRVVAYANLNNVPLTIETAINGLKDLLATQKQRPITIELIQQKVADYYGIKIAEMKSKKRTRAIAFPRQIAMYLCRELTDNSFPKIGEEFGGRDHTTVIHACEKIQTDIKNDPSLQVSIREIVDSIHQN